MNGAVYLFEGGRDGFLLLLRYRVDREFQSAVQGGQGLAQGMQQFAKHILQPRLGRWRGADVHAEAPSGLSWYPTPRTVWIKAGVKPSSTLRRK